MDNEAKAKLKYLIESNKIQRNILEILTEHVNKIEGKLEINEIKQIRQTKNKNT